MNKASIRVESLVIPTYPEPAKEEMPLFAEYRVHQRSTGRPYPNKATLDVGRQHRQDKTYTVVHMENEYLDVLIMPEIGGKIYAAKDKTTGYDFFYRQHVVKPGLIGAFGSWVSGGVEFNWPFHHRPVERLRAGGVRRRQRRLLALRARPDRPDEGHGRCGAAPGRDVSGNARQALQPDGNDEVVPLVRKCGGARQRAVSDFLPEGRYLCKLPLP